LLASKFLKYNVMKKLLIFVFMMALLAGTANTLMAANNNKTVVGEWKYEVPTAPYGYEKGVVVITEKDGELAGEVKLDGGYKLELKKVTFTDNTLKFGLYVDYEYVSVTSTIEDKKMSGLVSSSEGTMKLTAEKIK
jgi:hypothetical protein